MCIQVELCLQRPTWPYTLVAARHTALASRLDKEGRSRSMGRRRGRIIDRRRRSICRRRRRRRKRRKIRKRRRRRRRNRRRSTCRSSAGRRYPCPRR